MNNRNKRDEQRLKTFARKELDKAQQQEILSFSADTQLLKKNDKLKNDIVLRDQILDKKEEPSEKLIDRIDNNQIFVEDLEAEITGLITEVFALTDRALIAISALRKVNSRLADQLENSLSLKQQPKKSRTITKKLM
jgi:hypothetical protein